MKLFQVFVKIKTIKERQIRLHNTLTIPMKIVRQAGLNKQRLRTSEVKFLLEFNEGQNEKPRQGMSKQRHKKALRMYWA